MKTKSATALMPTQPAKLDEMARLLMTELKRLGAQYPVNKLTGKEEQPTEVQHEEHTL